MKRVGNCPKVNLNLQFGNESNNLVIEELLMLHNFEKRTQKQ